jgi:uncharacterized delta-60 repeat protein
MKCPSRIVAFLFRPLAVLAGWTALALSCAQAQNAGNVDPAFDPGVGPSNPIYALAIQPDGKIFIGGNFFFLNGREVYGFARLNPDGGVDTSFNSGFGANGPILAVALQADGKILIGGNFTFVKGFSRNGLARLFPDGSVDQSFGFYAGANDIVRGIAVQPDGQILVGGDFTFYNNFAYNHLVRLNGSDGSLDSNFFPGFGASAAVGPIVVQPDGKIVVGGNFLFFNGFPYSGVARLLPNGFVDTGFGAGAFPATNNFVSALLLQPDGKIVIGGGFTFVGNAQRTAVARLNADGSVDGNFFDSAGGPYGPVLALGQQPDGKIIIGGDFTAVDGIQGGSIARLQTNGVLDLTYGPGFPANGAVIALKVLGNGQTMAGGAFTSIGGVFRSFIARLYQDPQPNPANVRYLRLLSLNSKEFNTGTPLSLVAEAFSPDDPIISITFQKVRDDGTTETIFTASAAKGQITLPKTRAADRSPIRRDSAPFGQGFQAVLASLTEGLNNIKAVATTSKGAQLSSNTSAIMGASAVAGVNCQIISPAAGALPPGGTPVQVAVTGAANPVTVEFYVDSAKGGPNQIQAAGDSTSTFSLPALSADRPHYLTAVVTDNVTQMSRQSAAITLITGPAGGDLPVVVLDASEPEVTAGTGEVGRFTLTRVGGDVSQEIVVNYAIKGSAAPGVDYVELKGRKKMKAGKASVKINVTPLGAAGDVKRVVKLVLAPGDGYTIGSDKPAKVKIFAQ